MELDVSMNGESVSIPIDNPFRPDLDGITASITAFLAERGAGLKDLDVRGLIPEMVRGVAGCEAGCPADAKGLVEQGYGNFDLCYVEGGILTAAAGISDGRKLTLKLFPDF